MIIREIAEIFEYCSLPVGNSLRYLYIKEVSVLVFHSHWKYISYHRNSLYFFSRNSSLKSSHHELIIYLFANHLSFILNANSIASIEFIVKENKT